MWHSLQRYNCIVWQWRFYPIRKTCKKWKLTLSSSMAMYSVMRDIYDARRVPMEREWVALYLCRMQIFKSIAFRTTGLWKWITFTWYTLYWTLIWGHPHTQAKIVKNTYIWHVKKKIIIQRKNARCNTQLFPNWECHESIHYVTFKRNNIWLMTSKTFALAKKKWSLDERLMAGSKHSSGIHSIELLILWSTTCLCTALNVVVHNRPMFSTCSKQQHTPFLSIYSTPTFICLCLNAHCQPYQFGHLQVTPIQYVSLTHLWQKFLWQYCYSPIIRGSIGLRAQVR